jgi:predicted TIM-barrel fold metal-dependent hydrolase
MLDLDPPLTLVEVFQRTKSALGAERILFGSDSGVFPRGYRADILRAQSDAMQEAGFTDAERAGVLGGNLSRLIDQRV